MSRLPQRRLLAVLASTLLVGLMGSGVLVWRSSEAAFTASTTNPGSTWTSGTVSISDNDPGTALFTASNLAPGATDNKCITVKYTGTALSTVRLYATAPVDTGLASEIDMTIAAGDTAPGDDLGYGTCSANTWTNLFTGTLATFNTTKTSFLNGVETGAPSWKPSSNPTRRVFRITYTFRASSTVQGKSAGTTFQWEAQT